MKVLWLSNTSVFDTDVAATGSWISPLALHLAETGKISLCNVVQGPRASTAPEVHGSIQQWSIPYFRHSGYRSGRIPEQYADNVRRIAADFEPDLIHVWGTETIWPLLTSQKILKYPAVLEIQGLRFSIAPVYAGGLSYINQLKCVGLKEIIRCSTIFHNQKKYKRWGWQEKKVIKSHTFISTQSKWIEAQVKALNRTCQVFHRRLILRDAFYAAEAWESTPNRHILILGSAHPFKGLHIAVQAIATLKPHFPDIQLRIAGALNLKGIKRHGYIQWLKSEIEKFGVASNIQWLGRLSASEIIREMHQSRCMVIPSYMESYSVTMQEAMVVGLPVVASYVGGMPSLGKDEETALFFSPGDVEMCAFQIHRLLTNSILANNLSHQARTAALGFSNAKEITDYQLDIYRHILSSSTI